MPKVNNITEVETFALVETFLRLIFTVIVRYDSVGGRSTRVLTFFQTMVRYHV